MRGGREAGPAVVWGLTAVIGAHAGWVAASRVALPLPMVAGVVAAGLVLVARAVRPQVPRVVAAVGLAVALAGLAAGQVAAADGGPLRGLADGGGTEAAVYTVASEPSVQPDGRWWAVVRVERVGQTRTRERALLRGSDDPPAYGTRWRGELSARPLDDSDFAEYLRRRHVVAELNRHDPTPDGAMGWVASSTEALRARVRQAAAHGLGGDRAGLAVGLVTGDTRLLSDTAEDRMRAAGLTHLIAVSGSNVAVVVAGASLVAALVGLGARGRRWVVVVAVAWFAVLTRAEPSVLRAAVMAGAVLAAGWRGVPVSAVHALGVAVLVLVGIDPAIAGSLGLLLSAGATAGVLLLAPIVVRRLRWMPRPVAALVGVTIGAQVAVAPLLLATVGEVPLASIPANLIAVPAAAVASVVAGFAAVVAVLHVGAASLVMALAAPPLQVILAAASIDGLPVVATASPLLLIGAGGAVLWLLSRPGGRVARAAAAAAVALVVPLLPLPAASVDVLTVTAIDVGQGDAVLVEVPGARMLVDAGGDDRAATWLRRHGIRHLDLVVVSHPHADHLAGIADVLAVAEVGALWWRPVPTDLLAAAELTVQAQAAGVPVFEPTTGDAARLGGATVSVLWPPAGRPLAGSEDELNDMSIVLRVDHAGRSALLTGDIEVAAQRALLEDPAALQAGLLKVPHHGGATNADGFLAAVGATDAVISAGADNRYGHPHPDTLAALEAAGTRIQRTDRDGDVRLEAPPTPTAQVRHPRGLRSPHDGGAPPHGRRRAASAAVVAAAVGQPEGRRPRHRGPRRVRNRTPARDAHRLAVRWAAVPGAAGR